MLPPNANGRFGTGCKMPRWLSSSEPSSATRKDRLARVEPRIRVRIAAPREPVQSPSVAIFSSAFSVKVAKPLFQRQADHALARRSTKPHSRAAGQDLGATQCFDRKFADVADAAHALAVDQDRRIVAVAGFRGPLSEQFVDVLAP